MKKLIIIFLALIMCLSLFSCTIQEDDISSSEETSEETSENTPITNDKNGTRVVYIPLDNRPVNFNRASFLAESSGLKLIMPDESLISTTLGYDYDQGNPREIFNWLKEQEADYYVISLDMLFSGGLVGSRAAFDDQDDSIANFESKAGTYELSKTEQEIADYLATLSKTKHIVLLDTVMRLASTANYGGWDMNLYNYLRNNYASVARAQLEGEDLTVENIVKGYRKDENGKIISTGNYPLQVDEYLKSRERKLKIADKVYSECGKNASGMFIGVDDSTSKTNIQTNEIRYITEKLLNNTKSGLLFAGADELGLMGISEVATSIYTEITVKLQYFGDGKDYIADDYDPGKLHDSVVSHIDAVGGKIVEDSADLEVLVLTRSASSGSDAVKHKKNVDALIKKLEENLENNVPTCVIDGSAYAGYGALAQAMIDKNLDMGEILGFSAWNTVGNAIGISLSNAVARFTYLKNSQVITEDSHKGFMKTIAFSHIKDTAYKKFGSSPFGSGASFEKNYKIFKEYSQKIANNINKSSIFISKSNLEDKYDVKVSNLDWPWDRNFEAIFEIEAVENGKGSVFAE